MHGSMILTQRGSCVHIVFRKGLVMRIAKVSMCAAALAAAMLTGCSMGGGAAGSSDQMSAGQPGVGETAGNVAMQAGASQAMKGSGVGGGIGYGLQSQAGN